MENGILYFFARVVPDKPLADDIIFSFPDVFKVDFITKGGGQAKMIPFSHAYCTAISVNYGSSGPAFFGDGSPAEIDLTINLQETKVHSRGDIEHPGGKPAATPAADHSYTAYEPNPEE